MKSNRVMLRVEDFRAIGKAEIKLDGITVVAGVNGCGKSTLSKLLYWVYRSSLNSNEILIARFELKQLTKITKLLYRGILTSPINLELAEFSFFQDNDLNLKSLFKFYQIIHERIKEQSTELDKYNKTSGMWAIFYDVLKNEPELLERLNNMPENSELTFFVNLLEDYTKNIIDETDTIIQRKEIKFLMMEKIQEVFHYQNTPTILSINEDDISIINSNNELINKPYWIDNVIYIDTPMFFGHTEEEHWKDANEKLKQRPKLNEKPKPIQEIDDLIKRQIFRNGAEVKFDELSESFTFRTSSGVEMDLSDSATGMKTFAVLDRLVKNGSINKKTLLILDEPEAHLHPQWIVELGRLLTLINKHIGAKIFVATHSPDMVQALRYIPNKEGTGDNVNFYLAEFNEENGLFDYRDLQGEIDDIFGSFNASLDKLSNYGVD